MKFIKNKQNPPKNPVVDVFEKSGFGQSLCDRIDGSWDYDWWEVLWEGIVGGGKKHYPFIVVNIAVANCIKTQNARND